VYGCVLDTFLFHFLLEKSMEFLLVLYALLLFVAATAAATAKADCLVG